MIITYNYAKFDGSMIKTENKEEEIDDLERLSSYFIDFCDFNILHRKSLEDTKINQTFISKYNGLKSAMIDVSNRTFFTNKNVEKINGILHEINFETHQSLKSISDFMKKEQTKYIKKDRKKLNVDKFIKKLKKAGNDKKMQSISPAINDDGLYVDLNKSASSFVNQYINLFNSNYRFKKNIDDIDYQTIDEIGKNDFPYFEELLNSMEVLKAKTFEKVDGSNRISKIEADYKKYLDLKFTQKLLEQVVELCSNDSDINEIMPKSIKKIKKEYESINKNVQSLKDKLENDYDYLRKLEYGGKIIPEDKKIDNNIKDVVTNTVEKVSNKIEDKKEEKKVESLEEQFDKIMKQKISELDDSLSFSAGSNFKKFRNLSQIQQDQYIERLKKYLTKRVGEDSLSKALLDAKFELEILECIYDVKRDILIGVDEVSQLKNISLKEKQYFNSYERKLSENESEKMFRKYESKVKEIYRYNKDNININSPLVRASLEKIDELSEGRSL